MDFRAPPVPASRDLLTRLLSLACLLLSVALPLLVAQALWRLQASDWLIRAGLSNALSVAGWQTCVSMGLALLPVSAMSWGLLRARRCLQGFLKGETFSLATVRHLRAFAAAMVGAAVLGMAVPVVISLVLTWGAPAGARAITLNLASSDLLLALLAGIVWQVAAVFTRAVELAEEHAQIV